MPDDELLKIQQRQDAYVTSLVDAFERELNGVVASAQARTIAELRERLSVTNGKIDRSVKNARALRSLDTMFLEAMDRAGYNHLLNELVNQFPGQLPFFQETLQALSAAMKRPIQVDFSARDLQVFADQGLNVKDSLRGAMEAIAGRAKNRILLSVGGLPFAELATSLAEYVHRALPEAVGLAETATATYYRIIADRGYQIIEKDLPSMEIRYRYYGPYDDLTRPFCRHLLEIDKSYTRAEIGAMNNWQIPNVFISAGGWRCRHTWAIALD